MANSVNAYTLNDSLDFFNTIQQMPLTENKLKIKGGNVLVHSKPLPFKTVYWENVNVAAAQLLVLIHFLLVCIIHQNINKSYHRRQSTSKIFLAPTHAWAGVISVWNTVRSSLIVVAFYIKLMFLTPSTWYLTVHSLYMP